MLYHLPQAVLAAVIMMAVIGLVNVSGFIHAWEAKWYDGAISIITFVGTLAFAPHLDKGIMIGVVLSLAVFLYKSMRPTVVSLARAQDDHLRCAETHGLKECEYVALVRFDGPLFFANASYLEDKVTAIMTDKPKLKHLIIVSNGINDIDASGEETISLSGGPSQERRGRYFHERCQRIGNEGFQPYAFFVKTRKRPPVSNHGKGHRHYPSLPLTVRLSKKPVHL